jgi:hypothetical protein
MRIPDKKNITVRPMRIEDAPAASAVVARAFEDDPIYGWLRPEPATRLGKITAMNEVLFPRIFRVGHFEMSTTADVAGVAIWAGPERWEPPTRAVLGALPALLRTIGVGGARKMMSAMGAMKKMHPKEPHWYLSGLATDPFISAPVSGLRSWRRSSRCAIRSASPRTSKHRSWRTSRTTSASDSESPMRSICPRTVRICG